MPIGTVKFFNASKGYGFIQPDDGGQDAFVHITAVERAGMQTLKENQKVSYELEEDQRGKTKAVNVYKVIGVKGAPESEKLQPWTSEQVKPKHEN